MRFLIAIFPKLKEKVEVFRALSVSRFNASFLDELNLHGNNHLSIEKNGLSYRFAGTRFSMIAPFASTPFRIRNVSSAEIQSFVGQGRKAVRVWAKQ